MKSSMSRSAGGSGKKSVDSQSWKYPALAPWMMGALFMIGFGPLLFRFFGNLWKYEVHQFFPLALAGAWALAWRGLSEVKHPLPEGSRGVTVTLTILFLAFLCIASLIWSPWMGVAAALIALAAAAWWLGGIPLMRALLPAWIMLLTVIPPPLKLDARLALELQHWAVAGSSRVLALLAVPHLRGGNILEIPGQRLLVEEACSGINSVLFMTAACVFYVMWQRRSLLFLIILYVMIIGCVLIGNLIRITSGAWLLFNYQVDLFTGWRHETLGLVLTATYLIFIVAADALLGRLFPRLAAFSLLRIPSSQTAPATSPKSSTPLLQGLLEGHQLRGGIIVVALLLVLLGSLQFVQLKNNSKQVVHERRINPKQMDGSAKFSLPREIAGWTLSSEAKPVPKKTAFEDGVYSHVWMYEKGGLVATISLDYPFFDYHDVRICYTGSGWTVKESRLQSAKNSKDQIPGMEVSLEKENGLKGDLFYSTVDQFGKWLEESSQRAAYDAHGQAFEGGLLNRVAYRFSQQQSPVTEETLNYRIQLVVSSQGGLDTLQHAQAAKLFQEARLLLAEQFVIRPAEHKPSAQDGKVRIFSAGEGATHQSAPVSLPSIQKSDIGGSSFK